MSEKATNVRKSSNPNPESLPSKPALSPGLHPDPEATTEQRTSKLSNEKQLNPSNEESKTLNNFLALKKLRQTQQHISMLRHRFKVLKIKQQSNRAKTIYHENLIKFNEEAVKYKSQHKAEILKVYKRMQQGVNITKQKNCKLRQEIKQKNKQVKQQILIEKQQQTKKQKQQRLINEKRYEQLKQQDKKEKGEKRKKIVEEEKQQRVHIDRYKESRIEQTKEYKTLDLNNLLDKTSQKEKQLKELMKLEEEYEKNNMQSVEASVVMKSRLKSVLSRGKYKMYNENRSEMNDKMSVSQDLKLPEIGKKTNGNSIATENIKTINQNNGEG